jgi:hypothetical protein
MSDHLWTQDHIEAFVVGGLTAGEADQLERHVRECPECAADLATARRLDRGLGSLFAEVRADPGLEDRAVRSTRAAKRRTINFGGYLPRLAIAAGVLLVLASVGALAGALMKGGRLPLPGEYSPMALATLDSSESMRNGSRIFREASESELARLGDRWKKANDDKEEVEEIRKSTGATSRILSADGAAQHAKAAAESQKLAVRGFSDFNGTLNQPAMPQQPSSGISGGINGGGAGNLSWGYGNGTVPAPTGIPAPPATTSLGSSLALSGNNKHGTVITNGGTIPGQQLYYATTPLSAEAPRQAGGGGLGATPTFRFNTTSSDPSGVSKATEVAFLPGEHRPAVPALTTTEELGRRGEEKTKEQEKKDADDKAGRPEAAKTELADPAKVAEPAPTKRVILRSGQMEFEVDSFDGATATLTKLVAAIPGAFVATVNSDKLANGKVRGSITVRVPPEHLDSLVLDLRRELAKGGELKGMKIGAQDVTKQYTDLESRLRAARTMEQRLLQIIKEGKGEIKQLLQVEKELGEWRTKIEEFEGEIRYYSNLAALATLTVVLTEKEIRAAAAVTENERVQAGVEVEDVDKAYQQVMELVVAAKGRVTKSEVKQLGAGQFNAALEFAVPPESGGPVRDRLRQLGRLARLEIDRVQKAAGEVVLDGQPKPPVKRGDTIFLVQLYNLANIQPRETVALQIAAADVRAAFQSLRDAGAKANARVRTAQLNEQDAENVTAEYDVEVRRPDEGVLSGAVNAAGETVSRQITRAPEGDQFTDSKVAYRVSLIPVARLNPRETVGMQLAAPDVRAAFQALRDAAAKASARVRTAQLNEQDAENVTAQFAFEVRRADDAAMQAALNAAGETVSRQVTRAPEANGFTASKVLYSVAIMPADRLPPRETVTMTLTVPDVDQAAANFATQVAGANGQQVNAESTRDRTGKVTSKLTYEVPLAAAGLAERFKSAGTLKEYQSSRNPQAPAGKLATARFDVTLVSGEQILAADEGLWPQIRNGLSYSAKTLLVSVTWLIFGLCVVLPWVLVVYGVYRLVRRVGRSQPIVATQTTQS